MGNFDRKVLVLDAKYEAVKIVSIEVGFVLVFTKRASVVLDSERQLKGVSRNWTVPWIVRLSNSRPRNKRLTGPRFSRQNIYLRDGFRCQYCQSTGSLSNLTLDHLLPTAKGGKTTWENIVTACKSCNSKKGAKTLEEMNFIVKRFPSRPLLHPSALFPLRYGLNSKNIPAEWIDYLNLTIADRNLGFILDAAPLFVPSVSRNSVEQEHY